MGGKQTKHPTSVTHRATSLPRSALANGTAARLHLVMAHNRDANDFGPCWQRRRVRLNVFCEVQQEMGGSRQCGGFNGEKVSMIPHDDEEEKAVNQHLIYMYLFMYNADPLYSDYIMRPRIFIGD